MKPPKFEYHAPTNLDEALAALGRYGGDAKVLAGGQSLMPLLNFRLARPAALVDLNRIASLAYIREHHADITNLHLKDRKGPGPAGANGVRPGGANMPWGQGETPLKAILQLMKQRKYKFPASIEYEYNTPEGSDVLTEVKKCVQYCRQALA